MALQDLFQNSAVAKLLASMSGGANMPSADRAQAPDMQVQPPPVAQSLLRAPQQDTTAHVEQEGIRGRLLHATGADRISPELGSLLTADQRERVKPGLARTAYGYLFEGRGPEAVARERAADLLGLQDLKKQRDTTTVREGQRAQILAALGPMPQDPQKQAEWTNTAARIAATAPVPDEEWAKQLTTTAATLRPIPPVEVSRGAAIQRPDGGWEVPAPLDKPDEPVLSVGPYLGGQAQFKNGAFFKWVVPPRTPADGRVAATFRSQSRSIDDTLDAIKIYRDQLSKSGVEVMPGESKAKLTGAYSNLKLKAKEAANLGALTGPDVVILEELFNDPATLGAGVKNVLTGGKQKKALLAQLDQYEQIVRSGQARLKQNYEGQEATTARAAYTLPFPHEDEP